MAGRTHQSACGTNANDFAPKYTYISYLVLVTATATAVYITLHVVDHTAGVNNSGVEKVVDISPGYVIYRPPCGVMPHDRHGTSEISPLGDTVTRASTSNTRVCKRTTACYGDQQN